MHVMALPAQFGIDGRQENMTGALLSGCECLMALLAQLLSYELVEQGGTYRGIMGESPANTCLGLLTDSMDYL